MCSLPIISVCLAFSYDFVNHFVVQLKNSNYNILPQRAVMIESCVDYVHDRVGLWRTETADQITKH